MFGTWTIDEERDFGKRFKARCFRNDGYEETLTIDKEYEIEIVEPILPMSPLCECDGDKGTRITCHLMRFEKIEEVSCPT